MREILIVRLSAMGDVIHSIRAAGGHSLPLAGLFTALFVLVYLPAIELAGWVTSGAWWMIRVSWHW